MRHYNRFSSVQSCLTLRSPMSRSTPGLPVYHQLPRFTQTQVHRVGDAIQPSHLCRPLLLLLSIFPSIRVFSNELPLHIRWPKYWSITFSISSTNEYSGLISFRILAGLISLQSKGHYTVFSNTTIQKHQFFSMQPSLWSNCHIHTWLLKKIIALTRQTFVGKVVSLLFNMLSRSVIAFLPRNKRQLHGYSHHLQWFWSPKK